VTAGTVVTLLVLLALLALGYGAGAVWRRVRRRGPSSRPALVRRPGGLQR
jgi:hypothetical protein